MIYYCCAAFEDGVDAPAHLHMSEGLLHPDFAFSYTPFDGEKVCYDNRYFTINSYDGGEITAWDALKHLRRGGGGVRWQVNTPVRLMDSDIGGAVKRAY